MDNSIGSFIAYLRKEKNLTQSELAKKLNVTDKAISRWENNINFPDIDTIKKLCVIFDVTLEEMYSGKRIDNIKVRRKKKIKKILFSVFIAIFIFCFSFLLIYFINNYNTIRFYKLHIDDERYELNNSYIMTYKNNIIFNFGGFDSLQKMDYSNIYIEIYLEKKEEILYSGIYKNVYLENIDKFNLDDLYIKLINIDDNKIDVLKINYSLRYSNKWLFLIKHKNSERENNKDTNELINYLIKLDFYKKTDNIFWKKDVSSITYVDVSTKVYNKVYEYDDYKEVITYYPSLGYLDYQYVNKKSKSSIVFEEFYYVIENNSYKCVTGRCNNYDEVINRLKDDIKMIKLMQNIDN